MRSKFLIVVLLSFTSANYFFKSKASNKLTEKTYFNQELAEFLFKFSGSSEIKKYNLDEISRAISALSASQKALKSVDGATHQVRSTLQGRFYYFLWNFSIYNYIILNILTLF
jgi:hypothetical protein